MKFQCDICKKGYSFSYKLSKKQCGHRTCPECTFSEQECIPCGLRLSEFLDTMSDEQSNISTADALERAELLSESLDASFEHSHKGSKDTAPNKDPLPSPRRFFNYWEPSPRCHPSTGSLPQKGKVQSKNKDTPVQEQEQPKQLSKLQLYKLENKQNLDEPQTSSSRTPNSLKSASPSNSLHKSSPETSAHPLPQQQPSEKQEFLCHFHKLPIVSKHVTKNKFQCSECHVNPEQVVPQTLAELLVDLQQIDSQLKQLQISINWDIQNVASLQKIQSKTILVFNNKIKEARDKHDLFIPFTDNNGPITRFNMNRWGRDKLKSNFYSHEQISESKLEQFVNRAMNQQEAKNDVSLEKFRLILANVRARMGDAEVERLQPEQVSEPKRFLKDFVTEQVRRVINDRVLSEDETEDVKQGNVREQAHVI